MTLGVLGPSFGMNYLKKKKQQLTLHFTIQGLGVNYPQTTINWQNMKISSDSWNSLTLPFKVIVQLYEIRDIRSGHLCV